MVKDDTVEVATQCGKPVDGRAQHARIDAAAQVMGSRPRTRQQSLDQCGAAAGAQPLVVVVVGERCWITAARILFWTDA